MGNHGNIVQCKSGLSSCAVPVGDHEQPNAAWGLDSDTFYVAGDGGVVLRCSLGMRSCQPLTTPDNQQNMTAIWGSDANNVSCVRHHRSAPALRSQQPSLFGAEHQHARVAVWPVGQRRQQRLRRRRQGHDPALRGRQQQLHDAQPGTTNNLGQVWGSDANNVHAVGYAGVIDALLGGLQ